MPSSLPKTLSKNRLHRWDWSDWLLFTYAISGFASALWISDEWDSWKVQAIAFVGLPAASLYLSLRWMGSRLLSYFPSIPLLLVTLSVSSLGLGHVSWINASSGQGRPIKVFIQGQTTTSMEWDRQRGGLGLLYKRRW